MQTYMPKPGEVTREWHHLDATDKVPGRLAVEISNLLRGKHKPQFSYHVDVGDHVVVTNVSKMAVSAEKGIAKTYVRHSGYPGGLSETSLADEMQARPEEVLRRAVRGMLPKNRLGRATLKKLKLYAGPDHPHDAQFKGTPSPPNEGKRHKPKKAAKPSKAVPAADEAHAKSEAPEVAAPPSEAADAATDTATEAVTEAVTELEQHTVAELKEIAKEAGISGISSMKKAELIEAIEGAGSDASGGAADDTNSDDSKADEDDA